MPSRRTVLAGIAAAAATGCKRADWCEEPQLRDDGPFPYPDLCPTTASDIEGPYYLSGAPERADLDQHGDQGTPLSLSGRVFEADCDTPLAGAVLEVWHADPDGRYDNDSSEQRYRCRLTCDSEGRYQLQTLLPGRYLNGRTTGPATSTSRSSIPTAPSG